MTNLGLVSNQPVLASPLIIALLAGATLTQHVVTSVRGSRRQIGVLKSIGFTKRQVLSTVAWHASLITGGALLVGVPLGVVLGRLTWSAIVDNLGVVSAPVVPLAAIVGVAVLVLAAANLAALGPGWAAPRTGARPSPAHRVDADSSFSVISVPECGTHLPRMLAGQSRSAR